MPYYLFPEDATAALTNAVKYQELKVKETGSMPEFTDIDREKEPPANQRNTDEQPAAADLDR